MIFLSIRIFRGHECLRFANFPWQKIYPLPLIYIFESLHLFDIRSLIYIFEPLYPFDVTSLIYIFETLYPFDVTFLVYIFDALYPYDVSSIFTYGYQKLAISSNVAKVIIFTTVITFSCAFSIFPCLHLGIV